MTDILAKESVVIDIFSLWLFGRGRHLGCWHGGSVLILVLEVFHFVIRYDVAFFGVLRAQRFLIKSRFLLLVQLVW